MGWYTADNLAQVTWTIASIGAVEAAAIVLMFAATVALALALRAAARQPGGLRGVFGLGVDDEAAQQAEAEGGRVGPAELRALMDEADELAERLAGALDDRAARVEELLERTDARLSQAAGPREAATRGHSAAIESKPARHASADAAAADGDPMAGEIYRLADTGLPPVEIARRLSQHTGKVELILALRRG